MEDKLSQHDSRLSLHEEQISQLSSRIASLEAILQNQSQTQTQTFTTRDSITNSKKKPNPKMSGSPRKQTRFHGDTLAANRRLLQEILSDATQRQEFTNFCHIEKKDSLLEAWHALSAYEEVPKGKQTNSVMLSSIAQSTWDAVNQAVIFPTEVTTTIDQKITANNYSSTLFVPAKEYIFNIMVLFIVPSFLQTRGDFSTYGSNEDDLRGTRRRLAKGKIKESGKSKKKAKFNRTPTLLGTWEEKTKNLTQQAELTQSTINNLIKSLSNLSQYIEEKQNKIKSSSDDISMAEMSKLLPEINHVLIRQQKVFRSKFTKLKIAQSTEIPKVNETSPLKEKDLGPLAKKTTDTQSQFLPLVRRSSIIAERLWAELQLDSLSDRPNSLLTIPEINIDSKLRLPQGKVAWRQTVPKPDRNSNRTAPRVRSAVVTSIDFKEFDKKDCKEFDKKESFESDKDLGKILEKEIDKESDHRQRKSRTVDDILEDILQDSKENFNGVENSSGEDEMEEFFEGEPFLEELDDDDFQDLLGQIMVKESVSEDNMLGYEKMKERLKMLQDQYADLISNTDMDANLSSEMDNLNVMFTSNTNIK